MSEEKPTMVTESVPDAAELDEAKAREEWEKLLSFGAILVPQLESPFKKKQKLILTLRDGLRVGNHVYGVPVFKHYGVDVKEIEVMYECVGPDKGDCTVLALASADGHDKPKHRIMCKHSDLRAYPLKEAQTATPPFVPVPAV